MTGTVPFNPYDPEGIVKIFHDMVWIKFLYFGTYDIRAETFDKIFQDAVDSNRITLDDLHTKRIVLDSLCEGQGRQEIELMLDVLARYPWFDHSRIVYLSNICDDLSDMVKMVSWPHYMTNHSGWLDHFQSLDIDFATMPRNLDFVCLIRRRSDQRSRLVREILERYQPKRYLLSYASMVDYSTLDEIAGVQIPLLLDGPTPGIEQHRLTDRRVFGALINVIAETSNQADSYSWITKFITEKTFKCFAWHQIPVWWTVPGLVAEVRRMGFDVFDDIMQEHPYDDIDDPTQRLKTVMSTLDCALKRLNNIGLQESSTRLMPRFQSNYQHLCAMDAGRLAFWPEIIQRVKTI